jgi:hypothetical protein
MSYVVEGLKHLVMDRTENNSPNSPSTVASRSCYMDRVENIASRSSPIVARRHRGSIPLLRVYGPLPSNGSKRYNIFKCNFQLFKNNRAFKIII